MPTVPRAIAHPVREVRTEGCTLILLIIRGASRYFSAASAAVSWVAS